MLTLRREPRCCEKWRQVRRRTQVMASAGRVIPLPSPTRQLASFPAQPFGPGAAANETSTAPTGKEAAPTDGSEQSQLFGLVTRINQPHADTDQAYRAFASRERDGEQIGVILQFQAGSGLFQGGLGEVVKLQFDERLAGAVTAVEPRHPPCQLLQQLGKALQAGGQIRQIAVVGIFHADRLTPALDLHRALVDAMGEPPEPLAEGAEITQQIQAIARTQVGAGPNAHALKLLGGDTPHTVQLSDRQAKHELVYLRRRDHEQAIGLLPVTGDLGEELVGRNARRDGDAQLLPDAPTNVLGDTRGAAGEVLATGYVEKGFIEGKRLDQVGIGAEDRVDFLRGLPVGLPPRPDDQQVGTELERMRRG